MKYGSRQLAFRDTPEVHDVVAAIDPHEMDYAVSSAAMSDTNFHLHHDVHILPNGNILAIAWEKKSIAECISAGRDTTNIPTEGMWPCVVFEIQPIGALSSIVWEWHAWDHLVQDFDPTKANYGDLLLNKSRLNINGGNQNNSADWIHLN